MAHYCLEHKTPYFKKGAMKRFAHPIKDEDGNDTGKWCNEPEGQAEKQEKPFTYSPEKSASIETQVAVKATVDCWVAGKFKDTDEEVVRLRKWILAHLGEVKPAAPAVKDTTKPVVYADKTQLEQLTALHKQYPGEIEKLKVKYGFQKKLTKANAGKLIAELIVVKEAHND